MNAPLLPVPTQQEWEEHSRNSSRRSVPLRKIDKAVSAFNKAPATDHEARIKLADNLLADIEAWTRSKTKGNHIISKRLVKVRHLQAAAESERIRLQLLQSQVEFSSLTFNKVAVYSAGVLLHNDGRFADSSAQDYANAVQSVGQDEVIVRLVMLDEKLGEAYTHFSQLSRDETLGLFTIPEFFFKQPDTPFTEAQEKTIQSGLEILS